MKLSDIANRCVELGLSIIPIKPGSKQASIKWEPFQRRRMSAGEIKRHFVNGGNIALVGGSASGNLECLDFDKPDLFQPFMDTLESVNPGLRAKLSAWQETPSGGQHILYRSTGPVAGNSKLAMGPRYQVGGKPRQDVFIETRGEGGYFLVAPSVVGGKGYTLHGNLESLPVITADEGDLLYGIARRFDESGQEERPQPPRTEPATGDRPGDKFNRGTDWPTLLEGEGWQYIKTVGDHQHWCRPGKSDGSTSATLNAQGFFCFSSSTPLPVQKPLDKFAFYAYCRFNGDFTEAARSLRDSANSAFSVNSAKFSQLSQNQPGSASISQHSATSARSLGKERALSGDVLSFIDSDPAPFTTNDLYSELCARTPEEKKAIRNALHYQEKTGKIRKIDGKRGHFEIMEEAPAVMDLLSANIEPFNISLPLDISEHARVRPGSVILVSGSNNAGKTVFLLSTVRYQWLKKKGSHIYAHTPLHLSNERIDVAPMTYLNSEMSAGELVTRIKGFGDEPTSWLPHVKFIERAHSFDKLVDPDGVTFIDYLEVNADFFEAGKLLADIHRRLKGGVAVVAMQKKQGHTYAKGGEMTMEKPRLVVNLDKIEPHGFVCKITKAKEPVDFTRTIQGMERDFVISGRSEILPISDWRFVNESQRKAINSDYGRTNLPDRVKRDRVDYRTGQPMFTPANEYTEVGTI